MKLRELSCISLVGLFGCGGQTGSTEATSSVAQASTTNPYVFIVMMENHDASQIYGNTKEAPYINSLMAQYAHATNYITTVHPSEPNYIWLEAGSNNTGDITFTSDNDPSATNSTTTTQHIATQLVAAGLNWRSYQEGLDANTGLCPIFSVGKPEYYAVKHNPFPFFQDVSGNPPSATNAYCESHHAPFTQLASDLSAGTMANYNFVTPNLCDDMHGSNGCAKHLIQNGDAWLQSNLPQMINWVNAHSGFVLVVWDEGSGSNPPLPFLAIGPHVKTGYAGPVAYSHSSTVKSVQEVFGLSPLLRGAADPTTNDLSDLFVSGFFP
jgi:phospholipase C